MGLRGPPKTPTAILKARGSSYGERNPNEPTPKRGRPACPRWVSAAAKRVWKEVIPQLDEMGVLCLIDRSALTRYVQLYARWVENEMFIQAHGQTYPIKGRDGRVIGFHTFPQVKIAEQLSAQLGRIEREFGMTPSARTHLTAVANDARTNSASDTRLRLLKKATKPA